MNVYKTVSLYGYCLIDEKPPKIDSEALYNLVGYSNYFKNCVIIERIDKKNFNGVKKWIVEQTTLIPVNQSV